MCLRLLPLAFITGTLSAAWTVSNQQHLLRSAPKENRSFYISAHNFTNGLLMAAGPLIGGLVGRRAPFLNWTWPGGLPCCYFHILLFLASVGGCGALFILLSGAAETETGREGQNRCDRRRCCEARFVLALPGNAATAGARARTGRGAGKSLRFEAEYAELQQGEPGKWPIRSSSAAARMARW